MVRFNPSFVVNYAIEGVSLVKNVILAYSISSGEALNIDGPLGTVMIDEPIEDYEVCCYAMQWFMFGNLFPYGSLMMQP